MGGGAGVGGAWPGGVLVGGLDGREPRPRSRRATATRDSRCSPATQLDRLIAFGAGASRRQPGLVAGYLACHRRPGLSWPAWLVMARLGFSSSTRFPVVTSVGNHATTTTRNQFDTEKSYLKGFNWHWAPWCLLLGPGLGKRSQTAPA